MSGLLSKIKNDVVRSGSNKSKIIYFREGQKKRIRFLQDMDDGMEVVMHDSFEKGISGLCRETCGMDCEYCEDDDLRTRSNYVWSVYDYDDNEVKLFMFAVNRCSPIPPLMAMYENYGTLLDRDYVITVQGKQINKTYSVIPMDKAKFRNQKATPFSENKMLQILLNAGPYPEEDGNDDDADYDDEPVKKHHKKVDEPEDDQSDYDDSWDDDEDEKLDYSEMSPIELFKLCKERNIDAMKKKPQKYYINLLEEDDKANDDWGDDDDDEWEDEQRWLTIHSSRSSTVNV